MSTWDGIDEFLAVAAANSFTAGARAIGMSPTHVSRSIMKLEQRLHTQLFHRTTRTVRLTDTGRVFQERCERIAQERDEAIAQINERGVPRGELRVTCSTAMGERFIAPLLRRFAMEHSDLSVAIDLSNRIIDIVAEGFDLAIRTGSLSDSRLIATRIASRRFLACASPDYLASGPPLEAIGDLDSHECLVGTSATWSFDRDGEEVLYKPSGRFSCNSGQAVVDAALSGMGICQLPEFYVHAHIRSGKLRSVLDRHTPPQNPIWAVYPERRHLLPKIRLAVDFIRKHLPAALCESWQFEIDTAGLEHDPSVPIRLPLAR